MTDMDVEELIARHPRVFHTMSATAWPSVQRHGLLSTQQLIDLYDLDAAERDELLNATRKQSTVLRAPGLPPAVIRRDGALVEVTVLDAVPDILDLAERIEGTIH